MEKKAMSVVDSWKDYYEFRALNFEDPLVVSGYETAGGVFSRQMADSMTNYVVEQLGPTPDHSLLDIGCGCGVMLSNLKHACGLGPETFGIDISPAMIDRASKMLPEIQFRVLGMNELARLERKFDRIVMWAVLYYLNDFSEVERVIENIIDRLNPGGTVLLGWLPDLGTKKAYIDWRKTLPQVNRFAAPRKKTLEWLWMERSFFESLPDKYHVQVKILDHTGIPLEYNQFFFSVLIKRSA